ncbi:MAG: LamG-like jellyroll fold domain-containing protein [Gammaproteobacteria bacterium]
MVSIVRTRKRPSSQGIRSLPPQVDWTHPLNNGLALWYLASHGNNGWGSRGVVDIARGRNGLGTGDREDGKPIWEVNPLDGRAQVGLWPFLRIEVGEQLRGVFNSATNFSVWVRGWFQTLEHDQRVFQQENSAAGDYFQVAFRKTSSTRLEGTIFNQASTLATAAFEDVAAFKMYNWCLAYDGNAGTLSTYTNGKLTNTVAAPANAGISDPGSQAFVGSNASDRDIYHMKGGIEEFRVVSRTYSAEEVAAYHQIVLRGWGDVLKPERTIPYFMPTPAAPPEPTGNPIVMII